MRHAEAMSQNTENTVGLEADRPVSNAKAQAVPARGQESLSRSILRRNRHMVTPTGALIFI